MKAFQEIPRLFQIIIVYFRWNPNISANSNKKVLFTKFLSVSRKASDRFLILMMLISDETRIPCVRDLASLWHRYLELAIQFKAIYSQYPFKQLPKVERGLTKIIHGTKGKYSEYFPRSLIKKFEFGILNADSKAIRK